MTKKNSTAAALRATADAAVIRWRELDARAKAARGESHAFVASLPMNERNWAYQPGRRSTVSMLRGAELDRAALEAEDAADRARHEAALALDAAEVSEGDGLMLARDLKGLHDGHAALDSEEAELTARIADVRRRRGELMSAGFRADAEHAARRAAAGLPPSAPLPRGVFGRAYVDVLGEQIERGTAAPSKAKQIESARNDETRIAADLEEQRIEREAKEREAAREKAAREQAIADEQRRVHAQEAARSAEIAAEQSRRDKLARDYQARRASGGTAAE